MKIYPKNLVESEKLSAFFGQTYGEQLETLIAREPQYTYMAYLSQTGTDAPTAQVLFSNLENNPVFEYVTTGDYKITHPMINFTKCIVTISSAQIVSPETFRAAAFVRGDGEIKIIVVDNTGSTVDDQLLNTMFKIEIWL